jgi:RimJ/RimL family protein N-acetyltransferase
MTVTLSSTPVIETERLILRAPEARDIDAYMAFLTGPRSARVGGPVDRRAAWRSFGHMIGHWVMRGYGLFIIERKDTGEAIGFTGPWFPESWPEPELGWTLFTDAAEGKGYAFEAASAARDFFFGELGWATAVSYVEPGNDRSAAVARRLGAVLDPEAPQGEGAPDWVFRHPRPEGRA